MDWQLAEAKNKFTEVVNRALSEGPQRVKRRNDVVVIIAQSDYERLTGECPSFKEFLIKGSDFDGLDVTRNPSPMRNVEL